MKFISRIISCICCYLTLLMLCAQEIGEFDFGETTKPDVYLPNPNYGNTTTNQPMLLPIGDNPEAAIHSELFTIQERNQIRMLSPSTIMGDSIDINTGVLNLHHTDVSIPGNFDLPVKISRHIPTNSAPLVSFKHWALDVPYISGRLGVNWHHNKCSSMLPEESGVNVPAIKFFAGLTLNDGNGYNSLILEPDENTIPFSLPNGYTRVTKENWLIKCIDLGNGEEGFEALSPDGIKYTFDVFVSREFGPVHGENGYIRRTRMHGAMASKVEDRFGNYVIYNYSVRDISSMDLYRTGRLESITSSDGRTITVNYDTLEDHDISSIDVNGRVWNYQYTEDSEHGFFYLDKVVRPDTKFWQFTGVEHISIRTPRPGLAKQIFSVSVKHPEGAIATYDLEDVIRFKPGMNVEISAQGSPVLSQLVEYLGVKRKVVSGEGVNYTWSYEYGDSTWGTWEKEGSLPKKTHTTTVTGPDAIEEYTFYRWADWQDGKMLKHITKNKNQTILQTIEKSWRIGDDSWPANKGIIGSVDLNFGDVAGFSEAKTGQRHFLTSEVVTSQYNSTYTTNYPSYSVYGLNLAKNESNSFSSKTRFTRYNYYVSGNAWLSNFLLSSTEVGTSELATQEVAGTEYYQEGHASEFLPKYTTKFGSRIKYFQYDSTGNLTSTFINDAQVGQSDSFRLQTRFSDYYRGRARSVTVPKPDGTGELSASFVVDDNGFVTESINFKSHKTEYRYNNLGRIISVKSPTVNGEPNWLDTLIEWGSSGQNPMKIVYRCHLNANKDGCDSAVARSEITTYDTFLRPLKVEKKTGTTSIFQTFMYDVNNNQTFASYPSFAVNTQTGVATSYDALGRIINVTQSGGGTVTHEYLADNKVKVTDAGKNLDNIQHETTTTYLAYGSPDYSLATLIDSPENVTTNINYNIFGNITSITQSGTSNGSTVNQTEYRAYNSQQQLCQIKRNDVNATVFSRYTNGAIHWQAQGQTGANNTQCKTTVDATDKITYTYNNLGAINNVTYGDGTGAKSYQYDANGNVTGISGAGFSQSYEYNSLDALKWETLEVDGKSFTLTYEYDPSGNLASLSYPDGSEKIDFAPNGFGQATQAIRNYADTTPPDEFVKSGASYYANGAIDSFIYGNDIVHKTLLNSRMMPSSITDRNGITDIVNLGYTYDNNNNIIEVTNPREASIYALTNLQYDGLNRLKSTTGGDGIGSTTITYDALGNISTYKNTSIYNPSDLTYSYDNNNRLLYAANTDTLVSGNVVDTTVFARKFNIIDSYDPRGNVTHNGTRDFLYNLEGQMVRSGSYTYLYDGHNRRIKTTDSKGTSYSMYSQSGKLLYRETPIGGINYIFLGNKLVAKEGTGVVASSDSIMNYKPFGESIEPPKDDVGYTGHKFDTELGLSYMQARYYDPVIGRFYSNDPIGFRDVHSFNRYAYANNNPYKYTDPTGMASKKKGSDFCGVTGCDYTYSSGSNGEKDKSDKSPTPSTAGMTQVSLEFNDVAGGLGKHSYVVVRGPNGKIFVIRGGPSQAPGVLASGALSGSGSAPTHAYGNLVIDEGAFAQAIEAQYEVMGRQLIGYFDGYDNIKNTLSNYGAAVNSAKIPYRPLSTNSNAFAFGAVQKILGFRPTSNFTTPGSQTILEVK